MTQPPASPDHSFVQSTILVSCTRARVLFDFRASHSFLSYSFARSLGLVAETMAQPMAVVTPVSRIDVSRDIYCGCMMIVVGYELTFDLIILDMFDLDINIGID